MYKRIKLLALLLVLSTGITFGQDKILGHWYTENREAKVEIYQIGKSIFGKIISVSDSKNKSKIGLVVLKDFTPSGSTYINGVILEPLHNHKANGKLTLSKNGLILKVTGTAFLGLISKTETWTKIN